MVRHLHATVYNEETKKYLTLQHTNALARVPAQIKQSKFGTFSAP